VCLVCTLSVFITTFIHSGVSHSLVELNAAICNEWTRLNVRYLVMRWVQFELSAAGLAVSLRTDLHLRGVITFLDLGHVPPCSLANGKNLLPPFLR
jgi:hypothetical protein